MVNIMNNIIGIGTDIVQIPRIEKLLKKYGDSLARRILNEAELERFFSLEYFKRPAFLAKRFAAKESVLKALGCGVSVLYSFKDIEIKNLVSGAPVAKIANSEKEVLISISDDYPVASAFAIIKN
jgi:holo-[acyl-carrier protein] synthase